jgi:hypothetical protein
VTAPSDRYTAAVDAIDARNADDPHTIVIDGEVRPKELAHAELMTEWVQRLDPDATEAQLLAARAHHVERWVLERSEYPEGRAGYLRWRRDLSRHHQDVARQVMAEAGYDDATIETVTTIIGKKGLGSDPAVQVHEDALCLVFLTTQFAPVAERLGRDKTVDVVAKTVRKMSPAGIAAAAALDLDDALTSILLDAVEVASS